MQEYQFDARISLSHSPYQTWIAFYEDGYSSQFYDVYDQTWIAFYEDGYSSQFYDVYGQTWIAFKMGTVLSLYKIYEVYHYDVYEDV